MDGAGLITGQPANRMRWSSYLGLASIVLGAAWMLIFDATNQAWAGLGMRRLDPAQIIPLDQVAPESRESVAEVIRDHTFHRQGAADSFACDPTLYSMLVNEPDLTLTLWRDLSSAPVQLKKLSPNRYEGTDGQGASGTWDYVLRSPQLHVMLAYFNYASPRGNARIDARIVLVVRSTYYRGMGGEPSIQHSIEAFVKVDSKGWKTVARTFRPIIEKALEDQVHEAGLFVSLMARVVVDHPTWAIQVVGKNEAIDPEMKQKFRHLVMQNRSPDASDGRPVVAQSRDPNAATQRR